MRTARIKADGAGYYHCMSRVIEGRYIFRKQEKEKFRNKYIYRMFDVSQFMKPLKQRFSQYYNKKVSRHGPLWEQRFKSILVEGSRGALSTMAAYIDLNCVRAHMAEDPKDYRYCGYAEALGGSAQAREGIARITDALGMGSSWEDAARSYREYLYIQGQEKGLRPDGRPLRCGFKPAQVEDVLRQGGRLPMQEILRCRVRYFSDGLVLGSKEFVDTAFARYKDQFGLKRSSGARPMRYGDWNGLLVTP